MIPTESTSASGDGSAQFDAFRRGVATSIVLSPTDSSLVPTEPFSLAVDQWLRLVLQTGVESQQDVQPAAEGSGTALPNAVLTVQVALTTGPVPASVRRYRSAGVQSCLPGRLPAVRLL